MKKIWMIAVVACAALMIACGVESKAESYVEQLNEAYENGDGEKFEKVCDEFGDYVDGLSDSDAEVVLDVIDKKANFGVKAIIFAAIMEELANEY